MLENGAPRKTAKSCIDHRHIAIQKKPLQTNAFVMFFLQKTLDFVTFAEVVRRNKSSKVIKIHWFWIGFFSSQILVRVNMDARIGRWDRTLGPDAGIGR